MSGATEHRRRRPQVLLAALVAAGAVAGLLVAATARPMYTASATSFVSVGRPSSVGSLQQGASAALRAGRLYAALATSTPVLADVVEDLHLTATPEALAQRISARTVQDTVLLRIAVTDPSAAQASRIANGVQDRLARTGGALAPAVRQGTALTAIQPAVAPVVPSSPRALVDGATGALGGATAWLLIALVGAVRHRRPGPSGGLAAPSML
ncbi:hypothetical protein GCM10025783_21790 [Amnibacterium soli]|uniref:Polysaccharide chain length determinant N-terminal domain-containing protein n=1 Tax=Amnibacterium soli TaxID=1282736 RepID=A0ABP8Z864_9MICO